MGPASRISDSADLGRVQNSAFLTNTQAVLMLRFQDHSSRTTVPGIKQAYESIEMLVPVNKLLQLFPK